MKLFSKLLLLTCISLLIPKNGFSNEGNLYEVGLAEKVDSSNFIFKGRVISQYAEWNQDNSLILTFSTVEIQHVFKGFDVVGSTIIIRTVGGRVGNDILETSSLLNLSQNDFGMFFCKSLETSGIYEVYSSKQGFLQYVNGRAIAPFVNEDQKQLEQNIIAQTGVYPANYIFNITTPIASIAGGGGLSFSPSTLSSGTSTEITICGTGFGTTGPDATHYVAFANADDGGAPSYIAPAPSSYVSWSDTAIVVKVPTPAGTGPIKVSINGTDTYSADVLTIPYAILNAGNDKIPLLHNMNGSGGLTWNFSTSMTSTAQAAFNRALNSWRCATGINWIVSPTPVFISTASATDGFNVIARGSVPAGVLGVCYNYYTSCNGGADWNVTGQDIIFKSSGSWYYSTGSPPSYATDFESVALHELGHAHMLGHVVENSDVLFYALGTGNTSRVLTYYNIVAGSLIMNLSQGSSPCPISPMVQNFPSGCSTPILSDAWISTTQNALNNSTCIGPTDIFVNFGNLGIDTVFQADIHWTVNGIAQSPVSWTGALANGDIISDYLIGNYTTQDLSYTIEIWLDQVNGGQEVQTSNDTIVFSFDPIPCVPNNASLYLSNYFDESICLSNEPITVNLVNPGTNDLTSCWLFFSSNGVVIDSLLWTGSLTPGDSIEDVVIGNLPSFYPYADIVMWSESPNGVTDSYPYNDTIYQYVIPQVLTGIYTIGGASADYNSISEAVNDLNELAVCGDVIMNIRSGVYFETINLDSISNIGANSIVFQSEALNKDSVVIHFPPSTANAPLITFDSTYHVTFRNLSFYIENTGTYSSIADVRNGSKYINFEQNTFNVSTFSLSNSSNFRVGVYIRTPNSSRTVDDIRIIGNRFISGTAVSTASAATTPGFYNSNILIQDNDIMVNNGLGVDLRSLQNFKVIGNRFVNNELIASSTSQYAHLWIRECIDSMVIEKNHIQYQGVKETIFIQNCANSSTNPIRIANNSIYHKGFSIDTCALRIENTQHLEILNNTITQNSTGGIPSTSSVIFATSCDSINLINNVLTQNSQGSLLYFNQTPTNSNYNVLYTNSPSGFSNINGIVSTTFAAHQSSTGLDANSVGTNPLLYDSYNQVPTNLGINDLGTPITSITDDILGVSRNPITPDIGAFEFSQENYDIGVTASNLSGTLQCPGSLENLTATVRNFGTLSVDSFFIYLNINNIYFDTISITQTIAPGNSITVSLGSVPIGDLINNNYELKTDLPNNNTDLVAYNDTYLFNVRTFLNGEYSVGTLFSDFSYLDQVISYLDTVGVCGPVIFNIEDGVYNNSLIDEMIIHAYQGMSQANPVTFQSASQDSSLVTLTSYNPIFSLQGVKYMNFKHLSFQQTGSGDHAIGLDSCSHISISSCYFNTAIVEDHNIFPAGQEGIDNILIDNCLFEGSIIRFQGLSGVLADSVTISNCDLILCKVELNDISNLTFENNVIDATPIPPFSWWVIPNIPIVEDCSNLSLSGNQWLFCYSGPSIENCSTENGGKNIVANNFIRARRNPLQISGTDSIYVVNNSINQTNYENTITEFGVYLEDLSSLTFKNNILHSAYDDPLIYVPIGEIAAFEPDNNIYFNSSDSLIRGTGSNNYYSFQQWQNLGKDTNSLYGNPFYASTTDLHVNNLFIADSNAVSFPFITEDFDGEPRNPAHPDIGADEFDLDLLTFHDIELQAIVTPDTNNCLQADSIIIAVVNHSIFPIDSFKVNILLFNQVYDSSWINQTIAPNDTVIINLGDFDFSRNTLYAWSFEIVSPNGAQDNYFLNNSSETEYIYYDDLKITAVENDCNGNIGLYIPQFTNASILWSTGSTSESTSVSSPGIYSVVVTDAQGCVYTSTITIN